MKTKKFLILIHLASILAALGTSSAWAMTYKTPVELYNEADLVVTGETIQIEEEMDSTTVQFRIEESLKGAIQMPHVTIKTAGGRVFPAKDEPKFFHLEKYLLFLKRRADHYICLNQADGQKILRNENVYPYNGNITYSVPLEEYLKNFPKQPK